MKTPAASLCVWGIVSIVGWGIASPSLAEESSTSNTLRKFRGDWGCSFESSPSAFGPLLGLELVRIDRAGNVAGQESILGADPFVALQSTFSGRMFPQANGSIKGVLTLHVVNPPGIPDQTFDIQCIGMDTEGDRYTEMRCLDVFTQPDGSHFIGILKCKTQ